MFVIEIIYPGAESTTLKCVSLREALECGYANVLHRPIPGKRVEITLPAYLPGTWVCRSDDLSQYNLNQLEQMASRVFYP